MKSVHIPENHEIDARNAICRQDVIMKLVYVANSKVLSCSSDCF